MHDFDKMSDDDSDPGRLVDVEERHEIADYVSEPGEPDFFDPAPVATIEN